MMKMFKMLPPGYNISKLPLQVVQAVMRGEMPDLTLLPPDLQQHLKDNRETMFSTLGDTVGLKNVTRNNPSFLAGYFH
jgi:hypothetical protein